MTTRNHRGAAPAAPAATAEPLAAPNVADRLLRLPDVVRIVGLKRSSIYLGVSEGTFPAPVRLTSRAVAWSEHAVHAWVSRRVASHTKALPVRNCPVPAAASSALPASSTKGGARVGRATARGGFKA